MASQHTSTTALRRGDNGGGGPALKRLDSQYVRRLGPLKLRGSTDDLPQDWWFSATAVPLIAATQGPLSNVLSIAALVNAWRATLPNNGELPEGADQFGTPVRDPQCPPIGPAEIYGQGYWYAVLAAGTYLFGALMLMTNMAGYLLGHYPQDFDLNDDQRTLILQTTLYCKSILTIGYGDLVPTTNAGRGFLFIYVPIGVIQLGLVIGRIAQFGASISSDNIVKKYQARHREMTIGRSVTSEKELRERLGLRDLQPGTSTSSGQSRSGSLSDIKYYGKFKQRRGTLTFSEHQPHLRARVQTLSEPGTERLRRLSRAPTLSSIAHGLNGSRRKLLILREEEDRFNAMRAIQKDTSRFKSYTALLLSILAFAMLWLLGGVIFMHTEARLLNLTYFDSLYFCFVSLLTIGYGDISPRSNLGKPVFIVWSLIAVPSLTILIQSMSNTVVTFVDRKTNWLLPQKGVLKVILDANPRMKSWATRLVERRNAKKRVAEGFQVQDPDDHMLSDDNMGPEEEHHEGADGGHGRSVVARRENVPDFSVGHHRMHPPRHIGSTPRFSQVQRADNKKQRLHDSFTIHDFTQQLSAAIPLVARDVKLHPPKKYSFEEWVHFTKLIRYSGRKSLNEATAMARSKEHGGVADKQGERDLEDVKKAVEREMDEADDDEYADSGQLHWDWIGEDSPMLAGVSEAEWVLDRLCESFARYSRWHSRRSSTEPGIKHIHI
ncbi:hypothetical protein Micbo1qcDRAFT_217414 [Microdochium bolleyi]|uniref:Potassium channel domain-containing protein n=1 Tax=Microdochium bolleyi TaxID=196109 RepID=A0A136JEV5_9PEZI|nr:hypothetical protein Micbo1qcDRAFT_217414 [Microdochium bolleyi]